MNEKNHFEIKEGMSSINDYMKQNTDLLFSEEFITITLDKANQWLYINWVGYQSEQSIKKGCEETLNALVKYGVKKVLNDNTNVVGIWTPAAEWVGAHWLPRMEAAGLTHFAWVYSPSRLSQLSTNLAINSTSLKHLVKTFYNIDEAKTWLQNPVL